MRPPGIRTLLLLNAAVGFDLYLTIAVANQVWSAAGWGAADVGVIMAIACFAYAGPVSLGGQLADRWGRARAGVLGLVIILAGLIPALIQPSPWVAVWAVVLAFFGAALFFPGCAGLFSDAESEGGAAPMPLHVKISRYNLGWSGGNLVAFALAAVISGLGPRVGCGFVIAASLLAMVTMRRWIALPPARPSSQGDRAPHPALPVLMLMGRASLLIACVMGMAFLALLERVLLRADPLHAHVVACLGWASYAAGYVTMFVIFGAWSGWIFAPWRPWLLQLCMLAGAAGVAVIGWLGLPTGLLVACGLLMGLGYGACYNCSIYYSMRLPHGAARAASIHETCLGIGNTITPLLGSVVIELLANGRLAAPWPGGPARTVLDHPPLTALAALGFYCATTAAICLLLQVVMIPIALARARSAAPAA